MKKNTRLRIAAGICITFLLWTAAVRHIDVQAIGPLCSNIGFAAINGFLHEHIGVHMALYNLTDWMSILPFGFVLGFALLGLMQWIQRKRLSSVDRSLLLLGGFYGVVAAIYFLFEVFVVNCRPILICGVLEASYPSSTTVLVICVMGTACLQLRARIKNTALRRFVFSAMIGFTAFMVIGRLLSGVHWFTDIFGGILLSTGLVLLYDAISGDE